MYHISLLLISQKVRLFSPTAKKKVWSYHCIKIFPHITSKTYNLKTSWEIIFSHSNALFLRSDHMKLLLEFCGESIYFGGGIVVGKSQWIPHAIKRTWYILFALQVDIDVCEKKSSSRACQKRKLNESKNKIIKKVFNFLAHVNINVKCD